MRLLVGTDQVLSLEGLQDDEGNSVTTASVTARIIDRTGIDVTGNIALQHDGGGAYSAQLSNALPIDPRRTYILEAVAEYNGAKRTWRQSLLAEFGGFE